MSDLKFEDIDESFWDEDSVDDEDRPDEAVEPPPEPTTEESESPPEDKPLKLRSSKQLGIKDFNYPDTHAVLNGCPRIKDLRALTDVNSPEHRERRLGIFSVVSRLEGGSALCHQLCEEKPNYSHGAIDLDVELSLAEGVSRFCWVINEKWSDACKSCEYWGDKSVKSPIKIKGEDYIETKATHFWHVKPGKFGDPIPWKPCYHDLLKEFDAGYHHLSAYDLGLTYIYKDKHWQVYESIQIKAFAENKMIPKPKESHCSEFFSLVQRTGLKSAAWFSDSTTEYINLKNGVFDVSTGQLKEHSRDYGFKYILPYDYDPSAKAPRFIKFLDDVTLGREDIQEVIMEFIGYALANGECLAEKAMILYGSGRNGKSTFMDTVKLLMGQDNYASLSLTALNKDSKRYMVDGKLLNIGEETNVRALGDSEVFKTMVTGGDIDVKKLYSQDYVIKNKCKLMMSCNELPKSSDRSEGLYRRMLLIPFEAKFEGATRDPLMRRKLKDELPGIFNLAVQGYKRLKLNNFQFSDSGKLSEVLEDYRIENDNVLQWIKECLRVTSEESDFVAKDHLYESYKNFCQDTSNYAIARLVFFRALKDKYPELKTQRRLGIGGERRRGFLGLKLGDFDD